MDTREPARRAPIPGPRTFVGQHLFGTYAVLACAISWTYWLVLLLRGGSESHAPGLLGPMVAGFVVVALARGWAGPAALLRRMVRWRVSLRWYLVALSPLVVVAGAAVIGVVLGRGWPTAIDLFAIDGFPSGTVLGAYLAVLVLNGFGEEVGWRGVGWPALRSQRSFVGAAARLALVWAVWHIPTLWLDTGMSDLPLVLLPGWLLGLAAGAVVFGWVYERTGESLLVVAIFHANINVASASTVTAGGARVVTSMAVIVAAIAILRHEASVGEA
jgi:uncharacterized protein